jgi:hypothetical protein
LANSTFEDVLFLELNSDPQQPSDIDFQHPYELYGQAHQADPNNLTARLGVAITGLLVLTTDTEVNAAFDEWKDYLEQHTPFEVTSSRRKPLGIPIGFATGGEALRLPFETVPMMAVAHAGPLFVQADPQLSRVQQILRQRVIPKLVEAAGHLGLVANDPNYVFTITPLMQGDSEATPAEMDQTDVRALRAATSLLTAACRIAVARDLSITSYDEAQLLQALQRDSGWLSLSTDGSTQMSTARTNILDAVSDVDLAITALLGEPAQRRQRVQRSRIHAERRLG